MLAFRDQRALPHVRRRNRSHTHRPCHFWPGRPQSRRCGICYEHPAIPNIKPPQCHHKRCHGAGMSILDSDILRSETSLQTKQLKSLPDVRASAHHQKGDTDIFLRACDTIRLGIKNGFAIHQEEIAMLACMHGKLKVPGPIRHSLHGMIGSIPVIEIPKQLN